MKTKVLFAALVAFAAYASPGASAQDKILFEEGGLWYEAYGNTANVVLSPDKKQYEGVVELPSSVTHDGVQYFVRAMNSTVFRDSSISDFTLGEGFDKNQDKYYRYVDLWFRYDAALERLTLKSFCGEDVGYGNMQMGNNPGCVYVYVRNFGDCTEVAIDKFNVYGPDGKKLSPFLSIGENPEKRVYPDENGVFHLGPKFYYEDSLCGVIPISGGYTVVYLWVEYEGQYMKIRTEPLSYQSGISTVQDGLQYTFTGQELILTAPEDGTVYSGEFNIPETVEYNGQTFPVTQIGAGAFAGSAITSLTIPSSIIRIEDNAFEGCEDLKSVDISALTDMNWKSNNVGFNLFRGCESLCEVKLPSTMTRIPNRMFDGCTSLAEIELPESLTEIAYRAFAGCESLSTINLPDGLVEINSEAFVGSGIENIVWPGESGMARSENILQGLGARAFANCAKLADVRLPKIDRIFNPFDDSKLISFEIIEDTDEYVRFRCDANIYDTDGNKLPLFAYNNFYYDENGFRPAYYGENNEYKVPRKELINNMGRYVGILSFYYDFSKGDYFRSFGLEDRNTALSFFNVTIPEKTEGIEDAIISDTDAPVEYFNLQGIRVERPSEGLYIRRCGNKAEKTVIR